MYDDTARACLYSRGAANRSCMDGILLVMVGLMLFSGATDGIATSTTERRPNAPARHNVVESAHLRANVVDGTNAVRTTYSVSNPEPSMSSQHVRVSTIDRRAKTLEEQSEWLDAVRKLQDDAYATCGPPTIETVPSDYDGCRVAGERFGSAWLVCASMVGLNWFATTISD